MVTENMKIAIIGAAAVFALFMAAALGAQEGEGWTEKPLVFSAFYTCTGGAAAEDGNVVKFLEDSLEEIRPEKIAVLNGDYSGGKEVAVYFNTRGGETVRIHFYFGDLQSGTYTLETAWEPYSFVLFKNCGGNFRMYPLEGKGTAFEFALYNEMGRAGDNLYLAFHIDVSLLYK
jgi:hypothetical protein